MSDLVRVAVANILEHTQGKAPEIAIILGSGLSDFAEVLENPSIIPYETLAGFPTSGVAGHSGKLVLGEAGGRKIACLQGRWHAYEGHSLADLALPIRVLKSVGCRTLVSTCAAGSLRENMPPGSLMMLTDHINWTGLSPLVGENDDSVGPRFTDMSEAYSLKLQELMRDASAAEDLALHEGVYLWCLGPSFETPAEIRAFGILGADAVGMSTVPETLVARHCGMQVAAVAVITNYASGMQSGLSHEQTLASGKEAAPRLKKLLLALLQRI